MLLIPIGVDRRSNRFPTAVVALIAANVAAFIAFPPLVSNGWSAGGLKAGDFHFYQLWSYAFLHGGLLHLAGNMLFLWVLGSAVNRRIGNGVFTLIYMASCPVAGAAHMAFFPESMLWGASGAVSAVAGMFLVLMGRAPVKMFYWFIIHIGIMRVRGIWAVGYYALYDALMAWIDANSAGSQDGVAHLAHIGGFVTGALAGLALLVAGAVPRSGADILTLLGLVPRGAGAEADAPVWSRGQRVLPANETPELAQQIEDEMENALAFGDNDLAMRLFDRLRADFPDFAPDPKNLLAIGEAMIHAGRHVDAAAVFEGILKLHAAEDEGLTARCEFDYGMLLALHLDRRQDGAARLRHAVYLCLDGLRDDQAQRLLESIQNPD
jgi:membrane associated rhomboid family serine protease